MFGFYNVRKPAGPTSHDVVAQVRRKLPGSVKVGHAGTLDPFAEGVLVLCVGQATRLASFVQAQLKEYHAAITLGATSTTDDPEGEITPAPVGAAPRWRRVADALADFVGRIEQTPPVHSAVHVGGRRAYKLARAGKEPHLPARTVTIHSIKLVRYEYPLLEMAVTKLGFSARAYDRILKVARTIADLAGEEDIRPVHISAAIQYRMMDRYY